MTYDQILEKPVDGETIHYGILLGNETIVFIKAGADGSIYGYQNKYLHMARRLHEKMGATVVCASNPYIEEGHIDADKSVIAQIASERSSEAYTVHFIGTSDGAYHNLVLARASPQSARFLGINPSFNLLDNLTNKLQNLSGVKKTLIYGDLDEEYACVSVLKALPIENLDIITIPGADHHFTGMVEEFVMLSDLL